MKKCKITVMRITQYEDLMAQYENPISHACDMKVGQIFIANGWEKPDGFCQSAWDTLSPFVLALSHGGEGFYDGWIEHKTVPFKKFALTHDAYHGGILKKENAKLACYEFWVDSKTGSILKICRTAQF